LLLLGSTGIKAVAISRHGELFGHALHAATSHNLGNVRDCMYVWSLPDDKGKLVTMVQCCGLFRFNVTLRCCIHVRSSGVGGENSTLSCFVLPSLCPKPKWVVSAVVITWGI
jgi:hypothetical protein